MSVFLWNYSDKIFDNIIGGITMDEIKQTEKQLNTSEIRRKILFKQVGAKIAYYRTLRELSQNELARRIHVSQSTISRIERGDYENLSLALLFSISEGLQVSANLFITFNDMEKQMWWGSLPVDNN